MPCSRNGRGEIKTLADEFVYPRLAPVRSTKPWRPRSCGEAAVAAGARVGRLRREGRRVVAASVESEQGSYEVAGRFFLTSAPLTDIVEMMRPESPPEVLSAARALRYREHIGVNLLVEGRSFPDNWIYVHSPEVAVARISNYRNFSQDMAGAADVSPLTAEYFAFPGDQLSGSSDDALIARAVDELERMELLARDQLRGSFVVRSEKAYPVLDTHHTTHVATIRTWLDQFENLLPIGRSGMFKYNNQDHAMATGLLAARTALGGAKFDPWCVNIDAEYAEGNRAV